MAAEQLAEAQAFAKEIEEKQVTVAIKVGEGGKVFGSVSAKEIAEAAKEQLGYDIDKRKCSFRTRSRFSERQKCRSACIPK